MQEQEKKIIIDNPFYNLMSLKELTEYVENTRENLRELYWRLGGLESKILSEEEMITIYNFVDLLEKCKIEEV